MERGSFESKNEYIKPVMKVVNIEQAQMLCASLDNVTTSGLDEGISLPGSGDTTTGNMYDDAW